MSGLAGRRIVNTRAVHQAAALDALLAAAGATPLAYPCIRIVAPADLARLDAALGALAAGRYDWLLLTSANTVAALAERWAVLGLAPPAVQVAAVGPATAQAAEAAGLRVSLLPEEAIAEALADALHAAPGSRILLPESALARPILAERLRARGMAVTAIPAYETVRASGGVELPWLLAAGSVDAVTFTSSSTVTFLLERLRTEGSAEGGDPALLHGVCLACIGPKTAATARAHGLDMAVQPAEHSLPALVAALAAWFEAHSRDVRMTNERSFSGYDA